MRGVVRRAVIAAAALAMIAGPAMAEVELSGSSGPFFRQRAKVAVPAYHITYITQQEATSVASIGARTRLNTRMVGVDEALMRRLTNEAHADLVAQLTAAGVPVLDADATRALTAGLEAVPENKEVRDAGGGITIGRSIRRGYAAYGADAAPLLAAYHNPNAATAAGGGAFGAMNAMRANGTLGRAAKEADAVAVIPALTFDYINMETSTGRSMLGGATASASGDLSFSLRAGSNATFVSAGNAGPGYAQAVRMNRDLTSATSFAGTQQGAADVNVGSMTAQADQNYQMQDRARGDAVVVDPAVWEGLVRQSFQQFNAALVAHIVRARS